MLHPKKVKFRKWQKNRQNPKFITPETRGTDLSFGSFGLKSITYSQLTSNQIESARKVISKTIGKTGRIWIRVFPDRPYTQKAAEVPMGKGKGEPQGFCVDVLPGRVVFEVDGITEEVAREALRKGGAKLPVKSKIIARTH
jgi:large subunit ribosomal protein L16